MVTTWIIGYSYPYSFDENLRYSVTLYRPRTCARIFRVILEGQIVTRSRFSLLILTMRHLTRLQHNKRRSRKRGVAVEATSFSTEESNFCSAFSSNFFAGILKPAVDSNESNGSFFVRQTRRWIPESSGNAIFDQSQWNCRLWCFSVCRTLSFPYVLCCLERFLRKTYLCPTQSDLGAKGQGLVRFLFLLFRSSAGMHSFGAGFPRCV